MVEYKSINYETWIHDVKNNIPTATNPSIEMTDLSSFSKYCFGHTALYCPGGAHTMGEESICTYPNSYEHEGWFLMTTIGDVECGSQASSGGGSSPNSTTTTPVPCILCPTIPHEELISSDPCESLKTKSNETAFRQKFKDLNSNIRFNYNGETAYFESRDANNNVVYSFKTAFAEGNYQVTLNDDTSSFMHVHNNKNENEQEDGTIFIRSTVKMLSPADINQFISSCQDVANNTGVPNTDTYGIMISSEGIYAVKMLENEPNPNPINNVVSMNEEYKDEANEIFKKNPSSSSNDKAIRKIKLQILLLNKIKKYGLEGKVGLFEADVEAPEPGQPNLLVINWTRKTLSNNGELIENPC